MLDPHVKTFAQGPNFAVQATHMPDGSIQAIPTWVDADDEHIIVNTEVHRQRTRNLRADPRTTVTIIDANDPYSYVEVRGRVVEEITGTEARDGIDHLAKVYMGLDEYPNPIESERIIFKIAPNS